MRKLLQTPNARYQREWARRKRASDPEAAREALRAYRAAHPGWKKNHDLMSRYGSTLAEWNALWATQAGLCAICSTALLGGRQTHVDHDHVTGRVRALLCGPCNRGLGDFGEDPRKLFAAVRYLDSHRNAVESSSRTPVTSIRYVANRAVCLN